MMSIYNRTLPMPRPRKTVIVPARRPRAAAAWPPPPPAAAERPEADRTGADSLHRKHASAGSGTALAPMSVETPNKAPHKAPVPSTYGATLALLCQRWPAIFGAARPLKIGIHRDIEAALAQQISKTALRKFLARWTHREPYRQAIEAGVRRVDLDGNDAGPAWEARAEIQASSAAMPGAHALDQADPEHHRGSMIELEKTA